MRKTAIVSLILVSCLMPVISRADGVSDTKACDDAKGAAHRCAQFYGFRAELMCADWNKMVDKTCVQAQSTREEGVTQTPATSRNH